MQSFLLPPNGQMSPDEVTRKRRIAEAMLQQAGDTSPVGHWSQGAARLVNAMMGGLIANKASRAEAEGRKGANDALIRALSGDMGAGPSQQDSTGAFVDAMNNPYMSDGGSRMLAGAWERANQPPPNPMDVRKQELEIQKLEADLAAARNPKPPAPTSAIQEYQFGLEDPNFRQYQMDRSKAGATNVTIGGEPADGNLRKKLDENEGKLWTEYKQAAAVSGANAQDFAILDELMTVAPQGPISGRLASMFPGFSSAGDAFNSIVYRIAPTLRAPGSGATSDIEYEGMLRSLPGLVNNPEANRMIISIMKAKNDLNVRRGEIVTAYQVGDIDAAQARRDLAGLDRVSIVTPEMKRALIGVSGVQPMPGVDANSPVRIGGAPEGVPQELWDAMTPEEKALWQN